MDVTKVFRFLVLGLLGLIVLSITAAFFEPDDPEAVTAYLEGEGASPLFSVIESGPLSLQLLLGVLLVGFAVAYISACLGLLGFRRWARTTYIGTTVVGFGLIPVMGASLTTPLWSAIDTLTAMCEGAILVMLLFDPIKGKFARLSAPT